MIPIKTPEEIAIMRDAGRILARIMEGLFGEVVPGASTKAIENASVQLMAREGVISAFKGYRGYPGNICVSVNEEVVHGIPGERILREGDIVGLDIGIEKGGFFADMAKTFPVGKVGIEIQKLIDATRNSLDEAIKLIKPNVRLSAASSAVQRYVESRGYSVVRDFVGHGIGRKLHEEPQIPNFKTSDSGPLLKEGMVLAIEPMVNMGSWEVEVLPDGWTAVTRDGLPSAHFEHTVAVTKTGAEILTQ